MVFTATGGYSAQSESYLHHLSCYTDVLTERILRVLEGFCDCAIAIAHCPAQVSSFLTARAESKFLSKTWSTPARDWISEFHYPQKTDAQPENNVSGASDWCQAGVSGFQTKRLRKNKPRDQCSPHTVQLGVRWLPLTAKCEYRGTPV